MTAPAWAAALIAMNPQAGNQTPQTLPYPHQTTTTQIGLSRQNRPILLHTIGQGSRVALVLGGVHGDETPATELVHDFLNDLQANAQANPQALEGLTVHVVPQVNPDGVAARTRTNAAGVDLNRNMADDWNPHLTRPRMNPGPAPESEPETQILRQTIERLKPHRILSVHAFANILDYDTPAGKALAQAMAQALPPHDRLPVETIGYPTPGSLGKLCAARNIPLVTLELPDRRARSDIWAWQKPALYAFLNANIDEAP